MPKIYPSNRQPFWHSQSAQIGAGMLAAFALTAFYMSDEVKGNSQPQRPIEHLRMSYRPTSPASPAKPAFARAALPPSSEQSEEAELDIRARRYENEVAWFRSQLNTAQPGYDRYVVLNTLTSYESDIEKSGRLIDQEWAEAEQTVRILQWHITYSPSDTAETLIRLKQMEFVLQNTKCIDDDGKDENCLGVSLADVARQIHEIRTRPGYADDMYAAYLRFSGNLKSEIEAGHRFTLPEINRYFRLDYLMVDEALVERARQDQVEIVGLGRQAREHNDDVLSEMTGTGNKKLILPFQQDALPKPGNNHG